jgi:hypothetical protein
MELAKESTKQYALRQIVAFKTGTLYAAQAAVLEGVRYAILLLWLTDSEFYRRRLIEMTPG